MNAYVVSPSVDGANTSDKYTPYILKKHIALMGWGINDKNDKKEIGLRFSNIQIGDLIIVAYGKNESKKVVCAGIVASASQYLKDVEEEIECAQCRALAPFCDLSLEKVPFSAECKWGNAPGNWIDSCYQLEPENNDADRKVVDFIMKKLQKQQQEKFLQKVKIILLKTKNLILTGAPGTGKTYHATEVAEKMVEEAGGGEYKKVQFHPGYDYSDFITGLKPEVKVGQVTFEWKDGVFKKFSDKVLKAYIEANAKGEKVKPYIFIIDEINRADLSRVFGEVFSLLEENYRFEYDKNGAKLYELEFAEDVKDTQEVKKEKVEVKGKGTPITLPSKANFILPPNLYIIGTMNDIDRSVESMDFALRRRFSWKEVTAEESTHIIDAKDKEDKEKIEKLEHRDALKRAMVELNIYIGGEEEVKKKEKLKVKEQPVSLNLGTEYQLGGAYFLNFAKYQKEDKPFESLWNNHIAIILNEYLRGRSNRGQILSALKGVYDTAQKVDGKNNDDKKKDDTGNATADSTPEQPKAEEANQ